MRPTVLGWLIVPLAVATALAQSAPRYPGAETSVVVNRVNGRIAVLRGDKLQVFEGVSATQPISEMGIPGKHPQVLEFCGPNILYVTHDVRDLPTILVAVSVDERERLAWPNDGISEIFPSETSHLTLDGKGVYDFLRLDPPVRELFGLPDSIPPGSGVAATYRFAGEKLLARGSEVFVGGLALSPDDMLLTLKDGGAMRYRSPAGVAWKQEGIGGEWRIADVGPAQGIAAVIDAAGAVIGLDLDKGEVRWKASPAPGMQARAARLLAGGKVLIYGGGGDRPVGVFDPATGQLSGAAFSDTFARQKLSWLLAFWLEHSDALSGLWEVATPSGTAWLIHGLEGWYLVPQP